MVRRRKWNATSPYRQAAAISSPAYPKARENYTKSSVFPYGEAVFCRILAPNVASTALLSRRRRAKPGRAAGWRRGGRGIMRAKEFRNSQYLVLYHPLIRSLAASTISQPC